MDAHESIRYMHLYCFGLDQWMQLREQLVKFQGLLLFFSELNDPFLHAQEMKAFMHVFGKCDLEIIGIQVMIT